MSKTVKGGGKAGATAAAGADERPRGGAPRAVADMLPDIGRATFRRFGFVQSSIVSRWVEIVGATYARVSSPESIRFPEGRRSDGVLTLKVEGAHATMMQHVGPTIIERVNRFFGYSAVERIVIRREAVARPATPSRIAPPSLRGAPIELRPIALGSSLRTVGDPELLACLASLAGALAASEGAPEFPKGEADR